MSIQTDFVDSSHNAMGTIATASRWNSKREGVLLISFLFAMGMHGEESTPHAVALILVSIHTTQIGLYSRPKKLCLTCDLCVNTTC